MDWARIGWTLAMVAVVLLAVAAMWWGWRNRGRRQAKSYPAPPAPPTVTEPIGEPLAGVYVSTTTSGNWQDRIVAHQMGRRAAGSVELHAEGIQIERGVEDPVWIPRDALVAVGTSPGTAGKVMGVPDGILLITWKWGDTAVDTGFRADERDGQANWIEAAQALIEGREVDDAEIDDAEIESADIEGADMEGEIEERAVEQSDLEEPATVVDEGADFVPTEETVTTERKAAE